MGIAAAARSAVRRAALARARRQGLDIAPDARVIPLLPRFGSEPWLIRIESQVTISGDVAFLTHDGGIWALRGRPDCDGVIRFGRIVVHEGAFVGHGAILMPGVTVGRRAVVGAGSVVTRDVPDETVVAGNPARVVCSLDDYAERCRAETPAYDRAAYARDKRAEVLRAYPAR